MSDEIKARDLLHFNGIDAETGAYGIPPMSGEELSRFVQGAELPENLQELRFRHQTRDQLHYGVREGVDPKKLDEAGWGVIFAHDGDPAVREALQPLLELRREQTGESQFEIYDGAAGYRPGEAKAKFLARHGAGPGPADPQTVPYYLLIVGSPEKIPYRFQSQLDVQYAVGRIHFDSVEEYANYAASVVAVERGQVRLPRRACFFGVRNDDDKATSMSSRRLIKPVRRHLRDKQTDWQVSAFLREEATKANLSRLLGGEETPALLFTASHGVEFRLDDKRQVPHQGAILCQDWPGPKAWKGKGITQDFYFSGDDISADARLLGLICFSFACYGAGTPQHDEFAKQAFQDHRQQIAPHAFLGGLPKKMLGHPKGGALAFLGHVERAWGYSFLWEGAGTQTAVFESAIDRLLDGHTVGSAFEFFDQRYAELSTTLADELEEADFGVEIDPYELAGMWTANNDARGYMVLGDPAVRLPAVKPDEEPEPRPVIELRSLDRSSGSLPVTEELGPPTPPPGDESMSSVLAPGSAEELMSLTVTTYAADNPADPEEVTLKARTEISLPGDVEVYLAEGLADEDYLAVHEKTVREALRARLAYLELVADKKPG